MRKPHGIKYLTEDELRNFFTMVRDPRDRAIFMLAFWRGLRASEIGMLRLEDYRAKTGRLYIRRLKGSLSQDYRLVPEEERALKHWLKLRGRMQGLLFKGYKGRGLCRRQLDRMIKHYAALANIPPEKRHMHVLKHSCATYLMDHGEPITMIKDHLGHVDIKSTLVYAAVTPRQRDEMAERLRDFRIS